MTPRLPFLMLALAAGLLAALPARAEERRLFLFGDAAMAGSPDDPATSVPYWLQQLVEAGGDTLALDGTSAPPREAARNLPPAPEWRIPGLSRAMTDSPRSFRMAGFDSVILPAPRDGEEEAALGRIMDWLRAQSGAALYLLDDDTDAPPHMRVQGDVTRIPATALVAGLFADGPLAGLSPALLGGDRATPEGALLRAMVLYAALVKAAPPLLDLPASIAFADRQEAVAHALWHHITGMLAPEGARIAAPETGWKNPSLAYGLSGIADWSTQQPFLDVMKTARPWFGHLPGRWGGVWNEDLRNGGYLDPEGWPLAIPDGVTALETLILTDLPPEARSLAGRYVVTWEGKGQLAISGRATNVEMGEGHAAFDYTPGEGLVSLTVSALDPLTPLRAIRVVKEDHLPLAEAGATFNPDWLALVRDARILRFMDWMKTNGSTQTTWDNRPLPDDASYDMRGVPVEVMIELANLVGADPWFTMPHAADDAYVARFAAMVHDGLDPRLTAHVEWSNEVWNFIFSQADWAREQAMARWGRSIPDDGWMQYAGTRAAEVADIWAETFADDPARLVRVVATHTGWPGLEEPLLDAPLRQAEGLPPPSASFDAYAVTGYFGFEIGAEESLPLLRRAIPAGTFAAEARDTIAAGSLKDLVERIWPYHAQAAHDRGLALVMYEGGTHVTGSGPLLEDEAVTEALVAFNYSPEMAGLYERSLAAWRRIGDGPYMAFVDVAGASRWGSWGARRHLDDLNPRWATLAGWNSIPQGALNGETPLPARDAHDHGRLMARPADGTITGTARADILLGGGGDDIFHTLGGDDLVAGGAGHDRAVLPGRLADWSPATDGAALWMTGPQGTMRLTGIEEITFSDEPDALFHPPELP